MTFLVEPQQEMMKAGEGYKRKYLTRPNQLLNTKSSPTLPKPQQRLERTIVMNEPKSPFDSGKDVVFRQEEEKVQFETGLINSLLLKEEEQEDWILV